MAGLACTECGRPIGQWVGRCPSCGAWGSIAERSAATEIAVTTLGPGPAPNSRLPTGFGGVDRVLGGGLVPGSVVLVAGEPGIGKSTLLLQAAATLAGSGRPCLVASGEETQEQVSARAGRLGIPPGVVSFVPGRDLPTVLDAARSIRPAVLVVDSIQAIRDPDLASIPGGPAQVRTCADGIIAMAKAEKIAVLLAGQVTKDGDVAGPRTLEHAVDVVCSFDGDPATGLRVLAGGKNRFGPEGEIAWFEMGPRGLREVDPASVLSAASGEPGAASALLAAGRRALTVEIQALTVTTTGPPRRQVSGLDPRRFGLIAAVVDRFLELGLARSELYGAAAGGLRVEEPGVDLAVAAALASSATERPCPRNSAFVGEVALTGTVRPVPGLSQRLGAAAGAGIRSVYCAPGREAVDPPPGIRVVPVHHLRDALSWTREMKRAV